MNIRTATPNINTLRNAIRFPMIPSNPAVSQKNQPYMDDQSFAPSSPPLTFSGKKIVYTKLGIFRNKKPMRA